MTEIASTALYAAAELTNPVVSSQHTVSFDPPIIGYDQSNRPVYSDTLQGSGFISLKYLARTGVCTIAGRLPDGHSITGSVEPRTEGARDILPIYFSGQPAGALNSKLSGNLQFAANSATRGNLLWHRAAVTGSNPSPALDALLSWIMSKWIPPLQGQALGPFSYGSSPKVGLIQLRTLLLDQNATFDVFDIGAANTTTTFWSNYNSSGISLRFNPSDGTFTGSYPDRSSGKLLRRTFDGICVQSGFGAQIQGFSYQLGTSSGVVIIPYRP
jgi:hypothetical protein